MNSYWEDRYRNEHKIWGEVPSRTAHRALELFRQYHIKILLVPGSGYGRNTRLFSSSGFDVTGVEISSTAHGMAGEFDPGTKHHCASVLDMSFLTDIFDAVYCFNTLHLFLKEERMVFIKQCIDKVKPGALLFFTVFSEKEPSFGKGEEVEKNTFESKPGRPAHYFTEKDLKSYFTGMEIIETGIIEDQETHGTEGPHTHNLRYICAREAT